MKHLKITYTDGTVEDLDSKWDHSSVDRNGALLTMISTRTYGPDDRGPMIVLANVRKYEWVEGYK